MAEITTDVLQQALLLLIQDSKESRKRDNIHFERLDQALASLAEQSKESWKRDEIRFKQLDQTIASWAEQSKKFEQQTRQKFDELAEQSKKSQQELDRQIKQTNKQMGELSAKMGTLVEDMVSPDMLRLLREVANIPEEVKGLVNVRVKQFYPDKNTNGHAQMIEMDAIAECGEYVLINETKNTFRPEYVGDFLKRLGQLRDYFPEFRDKHILGCISSLRIDPSVVTYASHQGLLVFTLGEGMLEMQNEAGFQPKRF